MNNHSQTPFCILLVDDNLDDNYFHSHTIKKFDASCHVKTALDGEKALLYLENSKVDPVQFPFPDLLFLDINMPKVNGFEFLEQAINKKLIVVGKPAVVMLTGSLNPNEKKRAMSIFSDHISAFKNKPLNVQIIEEIVKKVMI